MEADRFAICADHNFIVKEDFMKAIRKVADCKELESKLYYKPVQLTVRFLMAT